MKVKDSIIIFFISIITLVAEFILCLIFGVGTAFSGDFRSFSGIALFFFLLMTFTAAVGVLSPICAFIGFLAKKEKIGNILLIIFSSLILIFLIIYGLNINKSIKEVVKTSELSKKDTAKETIQESETSEEISETEIEKVEREPKVNEKVEEFLKTEIVQTLEDEFSIKITKAKYQNDKLDLAYGTIWGSEETIQKEMFDIIQTLSYIFSSVENRGFIISATNDFGDNFKSETSQEIQDHFLNLEISFEEWVQECIIK